MVVVGLVVVALGVLVLTSCAAGLGHANPTHRLPGRLPEVRHPAGYMPIGTIGIVLVIGGAMLLRDSTGAAAWLVAVVAAGLALGGPMVRHNRRLPR